MLKKGFHIKIDEDNRGVEMILDDSGVWFTINRDGIVDKCFGRVYVDEFIAGIY